MSTRILIAEDDEMQGAALRTVLECYGHDTEAVSDGFEAVRRLRARRYDLALLDFRMPEFSGLATARLLHDLLDPADCPRLIAVTAAADELKEMESHAGAGSFDAIVSKQGGLQALIDAVEFNAAVARDAAHRRGEPAALVVPVVAEVTAPALLPGFPFGGPAQNPVQLQAISLAAFKLALGEAWSRLSHRAMMRAEQIIMRRIDLRDVVSRVSDHGFVVWFHEPDANHIDAVLAGAVREIRLRFLQEFGEDVRTPLAHLV